MKHLNLSDPIRSLFSEHTAWRPWPSHLLESYDMCPVPGHDRDLSSRLSHLEWNECAALSSSFFFHFSNSNLEFKITQLQCHRKRQFTFRHLNSQLALEIWLVLIFLCFKIKEFFMFVSSFIALRETIEKKDIEISL